MRKRQQRGNKVHDWINDEKQGKKSNIYNKTTLQGKEQKIRKRRAEKGG